MKTKIILEYIWLDAKNITLENLPIWNYDGSSTGQAMGDNTEILNLNL